MDAADFLQHKNPQTLAGVSAASFKKKLLFKMGFFGYVIAVVVSLLKGRRESCKGLRQVGHLGSTPIFRLCGPSTFGVNGPD
ncbi:hypothetical protein TNCV_3335761 [Trichonephila clavipes]|nr:hypothetical protein TNCV_3335761 [Trichonephila clavipes]